jgi:formamidopyrimidine-DNA glycosylase
VPELPEVETTLRLVRSGLVGRTIRGTQVEWVRTLGGIGTDEFARGVTGATIESATRRAKYIRLDLKQPGKGSRGQDGGSILIHLRMSGRLLLGRQGTQAPRWRRVSLELDRGMLHFVDVRKFGRFVWTTTPDADLAHLGPEPLSDAFTPSWLYEALRQRKRHMKPLLLDQAFLAGLGNIYVDEALHQAGLHPLTAACRVSKARAQRLHGVIQEILEQAIEREGSSFDGFYVTPEGNPGAYQHQFQVYGRQGQPCGTCGRALIKILVAQRGTHFCTRCQPAPRKLPSNR